MISELRAQEDSDCAYDRLWSMGAVVVSPLLEVMLDAHEETGMRESCAQLIGSVQPEGINELFSLLRNTQGDSADLAAWGLRYNHFPESIEPRLFEMLRHRFPAVRANAARALRYIHVGLSTCDSQMLEALKDSHSDVRLDILRTLIVFAEVGFENFGIPDGSHIVASVHDSKRLVRKGSQEWELSVKLLDLLSLEPCDIEQP